MFMEVNYNLLMYEVYKSVNLLSTWVTVEFFIGDTVLVICNKQNGAWTIYTRQYVGDIFKNISFDRKCLQLVSNLAEGYSTGLFLTILQS